MRGTNWFETQFLPSSTATTRPFAWVMSYFQGTEVLPTSLPGLVGEPSIQWRDRDGHYWPDQDSHQARTLNALPSFRTPTRRLPTDATCGLVGCRRDT